MGINFPASPAVNDIWPVPAVAGVPQYKWDGTVWVATVENPLAYVARGGDTMTGLLTLSGDPTADLHAVPKRYAASFDAMAYSGLQINGSMEIDQPNAGASVAVATGTVGQAHSVDGWYVSKTGTSVGTIQQATSVFPGYTKELKFTVTTAQASIGSNTVDIRQSIEGYRIARLAWGTASAIPLTIGLWVKSSVAGTLTLIASNSALSVNPTVTVTITSANVAQFVTATFPAQTTGTWLTDNGVGIFLFVRIAGSSNINIAATINNTFEMTGVVVLPGTYAPTAAQSPLIMRPYDQELAMCQRYYECTDRTSVAQSIFAISDPGPNAAANPLAVWAFKAEKRVKPTMSLFGGITHSYTNSVIGYFSGSTSMVTIGSTPTTANQVCYWFNQANSGFIADARL